MISTFGLVVAAVIVAGWTLSWLVRRFLSEKIGVDMLLATRVAAESVGVAVFAIGAVHAAMRGGWFWILAAFLGALSILFAALVLLPAGALWLSLTGRLPDESESP